ncbi:sensor histidine kinase [Actinomadura sp. NEAU-AAG7]|uniref:sensor histidine kinase n=1 Tax=Actinomadura sp. NEAU-AAG7 TaxID=2839640 RepID=UPI001BE48DDD|nr:sensor histidine kinase [Actinomadura sp. NEAU-AAG7]MBT2209923.1 sensor histidine kinase [Actinomadura sp. NEAU-AAG7]
MDARPQLDDRFQVRALVRWYAALWLVLGLIPQVLAAADDPGAARVSGIVLPVVLGACYAVTELYPRVLPPMAYLCVLAAGVGALSYVRGGGASLYIASLPQFWILTRSQRYAVALSGAAGLATLAGEVAAGAAHLPTGNMLFTVGGFLAGLLLGLAAHRYVRQTEERARRLSAELAVAQRELAEANRRQGAAEERERLAREIHDTLAQGFASIIVLAEAARAGLGAEPGRSEQQLRSIERTARDNFAEARALVDSARRDGPAQGPVAATLRRVLDRFTEDTGIPVGAELPDVECDQPARIALLRCTQESLANIRKHAGASSVGVVLERHPHGVELEITDDGRGFVVGAAAGFGLEGMRRRLAELGGELTVTSSVGDGTRIHVMIPLSPQDPPTPLISTSPQE